MQRVNRFARFWDMIGNSGRFRHALPLILGDNPFKRFLQFSDSLYYLSGSTWKFSLRRQFELTFKILTEEMQFDTAEAGQMLGLDYQRSGEKGRPPFEASQLKLVNRSGMANRRQKTAFIRNRKTAEIKSYFRYLFK